MTPRKPIDLDTTLAAMAGGGPVIFPDLDIVVSTIHGRRFILAQDRKRDPIQRAHRQGVFYETEELDMIRANFPQGGTFIDIGSNIGNHALYVAAFLQPARIVVFEPNPIAYKLLLANVAMNAMTEVIDTRHVGLGLSDKPEENFGMNDPDVNLGSARMQSGGGDIRVIAGDTALAGLAPDMLKIDVEGMEMQVLAGLEGTVAAHRPDIFIEVDQENYTAFEAWAEAQGYETVATHQRYRINRNYLLRHPDRG